MAKWQAFVTWVEGYTRDLERHDALRAASAMAFHAFFGLLPLVAVLGWVAHRLTRSPDLFVTPLLELAPTQVTSVADTEYMRLSGGSEMLVAPLSIAGFVWLAGGGVATAMRVFERIFEAPRRSWLRRRALALVFVVLAIALLALGGAGALMAAFGGDLASRVAAVAAPTVAMWLLVATFFRYATRRHPGTPRRGFRGAAATVVMWMIVSAGFSFYVARLASYSRFYGRLATVVVLLVWLWLMAFSLILGGEINAHIEGTRRHPDSEPHGEREPEPDAASES